jgi:hypothetical protein
MAIARKNRRPIKAEGRDYLWSVYEDLEEGAAMTLVVASVDKAFLVRYPIHQPDDTRHLTVIGREFPGLPDRRPSWARVRCPPLTSGEAVKPSDVRKLIEWCLHTKRDLIQVDWMGRKIMAESPAMKRTKPAMDTTRRTSRKRVVTFLPVRRSGRGLRR